MSGNRSAFLDMLAWSEGTSTITDSDDGYNVLCGATPEHPLLFESYADHPRVLNAELDSTARGGVIAKWGTFKGRPLGAAAMLG